MNNFRLLLIALIIFCSGCSTGLYNYKDVTKESNIQTFKQVPIYVDTKFTVQQKQVIFNVINEWNHVLNNQMRMEVLDWKFDLNTDAGKNVKKDIELTDEGIIILSVKSTDPILGKYENDGGQTLAFVDHLGNKAHHVFVLNDRIGKRNFHKIMLHEFGHTLGAMHVSASSLMFPYIGYMQRDCVDKITAAQVASYNNLNLQYMNYCVTPDFE